MKRNWIGTENILCIRLDNMGDLLMSSPAIRALKETFRSQITVLTSSMAGKIAKYIPGVDDVLISDVPWVKTDSSDGPAGYFNLVETIKEKGFDASVVFNVYSQNPLPSAMIPYLAGVPLRLAYCRENPYELLTDWVPDKEPLSNISHQVTRDLQLVANVGASASSDELTLNVPNYAYSSLQEKLSEAGVSLHHPWIIVHPGASETKREYPSEDFNNILKRVVDELDVQLILTGNAKEKILTERLRCGIESRSVSVAGMFSIEEFMALIDLAPLVLSVNTGTVHIAAALKTPVVVLYALTNPQHTPWKVTSKVFTFPVDEDLQSKNEIIRYVNNNIVHHSEYPQPEDVVNSLKQLMRTFHPRPVE